MSEWRKSGACYNKSKQVLLQLIAANELKFSAMNFVVVVSLNVCILFMFFWVEH